MDKYFRVVDQEQISLIKVEAEKINSFDRRLLELKEQYKADEMRCFDSIDSGLRFSCMWFKDMPLHLDIKKIFKMSKGYSARGGYEIRPRKGNKNFFKSFSSGLEDISYEGLITALIGSYSKYGLNLTYSIGSGDFENVIMFKTNKDEVSTPVLEITASEYISFVGRVSGE